MLSSSRFMYLCSINHSICSLIIFLEGKNIFFKMSTSSVCSCALDIRCKCKQNIVFLWNFVKNKMFKNCECESKNLNLLEWVLTFLILRILMIASWVLKIRSCIILSFSSFLAFSVDNWSLPIKLILPRFCSLPFFKMAKSWLILNSVSSVNSEGFVTWGS